MATWVDRADRLQRRKPWLGMPIGVFYKFIDDQGGYLAAVLTYYAFVAIFPILLIASSVLGFVLQGQPALREQLLASALGQFPIVGDQLGRPEGLRGSASAVVVGALTAVYGMVGLGQAAQNAVNAVWAIPRNQRFNPLLSRLISVVWLVLAGLVLVLIAALPSLARYLEAFGLPIGSGVKWLAVLVSVGLNAGVLAVMLRLSTPDRTPWRAVVRGAVAIAVMWQLLQVLGGAYVEQVIRKATEMNAVFAVVLGLVAFLYIANLVAVLGLEINVVHAKSLYPRSLMTLFSEDVELTEADQKVYRERAQAQAHKGSERVSVTFETKDDP